ncbi:radical SAM protein [Patescibacteria group bacterium]|nr:radical SAM protein [Patescibacteria group bacterium]MBU1952771.1 radical SAM protein [Patescibacteria group bacterium]
MKYKLGKGVYLVKGVHRGAILDTNSGNVYSINQAAVGILSNKSSDAAYWEKLLNLGLATKCSRHSYSKLPKDEGQANLNFVWFEICTSRCNERCIQCYVDSGEAGNKDVYCNQTPIRFEGWVSLIKEARDLGCKRGQFIGGEPFLFRGSNKETVLDLAEYAIEIGFNSIEIFSNLTLVKSQDIVRIKSLGLKIATTIYSHDEKIHDYITRTPGSHRKTVAVIKQLRNLGVLVRAETVLMRANQETIEETLKFKRELGIQSSKIDPLRPTGRGNNSTLLPDMKYILKYGCLMEPNFQTNKESLCNHTSFNSCLKGCLTVTEFGDFLPCIFLRGTILGNYKETNLTNLVERKQVQDIWKSTKDSVLVCKDCEYRYCCFDCRALSFGSCGGKLSLAESPYPRCTYNPYTGEWNKGLWLLDESGRVTYNRNVITS